MAPILPVSEVLEVVRFADGCAGFARGGQRNVLEEYGRDFVVDVDTAGDYGGTILLLFPAMLHLLIIK